MLPLTLDMSPLCHGYVCHGYVFHGYSTSQIPWLIPVPHHEQILSFALQERKRLDLFLSLDTKE